ncbi:MAG: hypothetical protein QOD92_1037 [Acidimicrobiaceae bacterium]|jgi:hypothetical protein
MPLYLNGRPATTAEVVAAMPENVVDRLAGHLADSYREHHGADDPESET